MAALCALDNQDDQSSGSGHKAASTEWAQETVVKFYKTIKGK